MVASSLLGTIRRCDRLRHVLLPLLGITTAGDFSGVRMGRHNHGVRLALWKNRRRRYMRRHQRAWGSSGHYKYTSILGGPVVVVHRRHIDVGVVGDLMPSHREWDKTTDHAYLLGMLHGWPFVVTRDGRHKCPHIHGIPTINVSLTGHVLRPSFALVGFHVRAVQPARHQPGRGGAFRRGCWGAFIHQKLNSGLWPSWDPKHRTPIDPAT